MGIDERKHSTLDKIQSDKLFFRDAPIIITENKSYSPRLPLFLSHETFFTSTNEKKNIF